MNIIEIIAKKRNKQALTKEEIDYFIENYTNGNIADYQASSLIMAIYLNGMTEEETKNLSIAMANSGERLDLSDISNIIVDKHSSGGVGDKITLIVMPIVASLGVKVAKMSGRGLGITGGTIDKLESITGYKTNLSIEEFKQNVKKIGISLIRTNRKFSPSRQKVICSKRCNSNSRKLTANSFKHNEQKNGIRSKQTSSRSNLWKRSFHENKGRCRKSCENYEETRRTERNRNNLYHHKYERANRKNSTEML